MPNVLSRVDGIFTGSRLGTNAAMDHEFRNGTFMFLG
jgi:hypothetical protein